MTARTASNCRKVEAVRRNCVKTKMQSGSSFHGNQVATGGAAMLRLSFRAETLKKQFATGSNATEAGDMCYGFPSGQFQEKIRSVFACGIA
ncbi:hypothetical protein [Mesorhizobium sp. WSM3860]|uniref:hypothetical protein n=1 Tax=Mesorhizobium sp. WSM3860 TaxID=2029403 RepID=UPI00114106ED|nr:hypothetical protein [Mesorhizobium sp. WSM3860]